MDKTINFGLIGKKLTHSFSPQFFSRRWPEKGLLNWKYQRYEVENEHDLGKLLEDTDVKGFNVTIPYKISIIPLLKRLSRQASEIGAVNVIFRASQGWIGHNTDGPAFLQCLEKYYPIKKNGKVLVLGTGGASHAIRWALRKYGWPFLVCGRANADVRWEALENLNMDEIKLVINTTPLGMHPNSEDLPPLPYHRFLPGTDAIDLIYNPSETLFLKRFKQAGGNTHNGLEMLEIQAIMSEKWWIEQLETNQKISIHNP